MSGRLYLIGTPIGNLGDLSDRARLMLAGVDLLAAEDTRRTRTLLRHAGVDRPMVSLFEGNERERTQDLLARLRDGAAVGLVTDAGMPTISDPGFRLVRACVEEGIDVRVVPGPSAAISALVVSGLPVERFTFEGFLPRRSAERRARLRALADDPRTMVLFESPRRLAGLLRDVVAELGDRRVAVARELTKLHEEVRRGRATELLEGLDGPVRGEVTVVVEGARGAGPPPLTKLLEEAQGLVARGSRKREAAATVARAHGASANAIYRALIGRSEP
jgi:16S rRNA (cytidine1402-2'-O)-methyltransferase